MKLDKLLGYFFIVCFLVILGLIIERVYSLLGYKDNSYTIRQYENGKPKTQQEYWELGNRLLHPADFDEDWLLDTYRLDLGLDAEREHFFGDDIAMGMHVCLTRGNARYGQNPYCFTQKIYKYSAEEQAQVRFNKWLDITEWQTESEFFSFVNKLDATLIQCGLASPSEWQGWNEPYHSCAVKMLHEDMFVLIDIEITENEEPVSFEEIAELLQLIQTKMLDPDADKIPDGLVAPVPLGD